MIFSGPMIYDCPFTSEYEKYLGNFEMIDFIVVWWTVFLNVMILSGPMIYDSPFTSEYEKYIENFELIDFIDVWWTVFFFYCDDFVWTNDLWFPIYIRIWKIHREFWNDRLHWRLMNSFFLNLMILSGPMIFDSPFTSECEKNIVKFEMIDFIDVWWTVFNVMILSGWMIYDSPFTCEYEKYIEKFEMIDCIDVWWTVFFWMW